MITVLTNLYVTESLDIGTINTLNWPLLISTEYVTSDEPVELTPVLDMYAVEPSWVICSSSIAYLLFVVSVILTEYFALLYVAIGKLSRGCAAEEPEWITTPSDCEEWFNTERPVIVVADNVPFTCRLSAIVTAEESVAYGLADEIITSRKEDGEE